MPRWRIVGLALAAELGVEERSMVRKLGRNKLEESKGREARKEEKKGCKGGPSC